MKCRLIAEARAINPEYSAKDRNEAKAAGKVYDVPNIITRPVGHVQDHPDCWKHCCRGFLNSEPIAVPEDEECREAVRAWLKRRPQQLKAIAAMLSGGEPASRKGKAFYKAMRQAYAVDLHEIDPDNFPLGGNDAELHEEDEDD